METRIRFKNPKATVNRMCFSIFIHTWQILRSIPNLSWLQHTNLLCIHFKNSAGTHFWDHNIEVKVAKSSVKHRHSVFLLWRSEMQHDIPQIQSLMTTLFVGPWLYCGKIRLFLLNQPFSHKKKKKKLPFYRIPPKLFWCPFSGRKKVIIIIIKFSIFATKRCSKNLFLVLF